MVQVIPIPAFNDNYIWALVNTANNYLYVVDPGDAEPVFMYCLTHNYTLKGILITHHHWDHTNGVKQLVSHFQDIPVFGPENSEFKGITHLLSDGETIELPELALSLNIMHIPGHTLDHIAYYNEHMVFCGDTLFNGGCGRLFEGSPAQMLTSLKQIAALPDKTLVYCTHEYTRANLEFARYIEPDNEQLNSYHSQLQQHNEISLPTTVAQQKAINPFLRSEQQQVKASIIKKSNASITDPIAIFAALRELKDNF